MIYLFPHCAETNVFGQNLVDHKVQLPKGAKNQKGKTGGAKKRILWSTCPLETAKIDVFPSKKRIL